MILAGATIAPYKTGGSFGGVPEECRWLTEAEETFLSAKRAGHELHYLVVFEEDARENRPYARLVERMIELQGNIGDAMVERITFTLDDGATTVDHSNRLRRICTGRNLITERALTMGADWICFLDTDTRPDPTWPEKLLEMRWPIVGGEVAAYHGPNGLGPWGETSLTEMPWTTATLCGVDRDWTPPDREPWRFPVTQHWNTAGFLMVHRSLFRRLRWRHDEIDGALTDDPCYAEDAERLGFPTFVRQDCEGSHEPLSPLERRGCDLRIRR